MKKKMKNGTDYSKIIGQMQRYYQTRNKETIAPVSLPKISIQDYEDEEDENE